MFMWPGTPSPRAKGNETADYNELLIWKEEIADFSELVSWQTDLSSDQYISNQLSKLDENDYTDGVPVEDDLVELVGEAFAAVQERAEICGDGYPFQLDSSGNVLQPRPGAANAQHVVYKYLLLATRLNMSTNKKHAELDGTVLFEELCAEVARSYFGQKSIPFLFGTANGMDKFEDKVDKLCYNLGEGGRFRNIDKRTPTAKDDGLDVAVWTPFSDRKPGKLIGFAQCKTGTNYGDAFTRLQPEAFCKNWFETMPSVPPVRMFFVAEALRREGWYQKANLAGILLDRCRIIEFCNEISSVTLTKLTTWTEAAAYNTGIEQL